MPVPTGVSLVINTGDDATNDLDVVLTIAADGASGGTHSMRVSNNGGADWSPLEAFATSKAWNLCDFGGVRVIAIGVAMIIDSIQSISTLKNVSREGHHVASNCSDKRQHRIGFFDRK